MTLTTDQLTLNIGARDAFSAGGQSWLNITELKTLDDSGIGDVCGLCGGEGIDDSWVEDDGMATKNCSRCGGCGMAAPTAIHVRRTYARLAEDMTPPERTIMALAVKVLVHHEAGDGPRPWPYDASPDGS